MNSITEELTLELVDRFNTDLNSALKRLAPGKYTVVFLAPKGSLEQGTVKLESVIMPSDFYPDLFDKSIYGGRPQTGHYEIDIPSREAKRAKSIRK